MDPLSRFFRRFAGVNVGERDGTETVLVQVSEESVSADRLLGWVDDPKLGGRTLFLGAVRDRNMGRNVVAVSYDAFVPMAEAALREICDEARRRWGQAIRIAVHHRTGRLGVGHVSVGIAVGSPHRDEGYRASRYVIEELKKRVPIWKKEHYEDGESEWLKGHALCSHDSSREHDGSHDRDRSCGRAIDEDGAKQGTAGVFRD